MKKLLIYSCCLLCFSAACQNAPLIESVRIEKTDTIAPVKTDAGIVLASEQQAYPLSVQKLIKAYPGHFSGFEDNHLIWKDGTKMLWDDARKDKTFSQLINESDLEDQLTSMAYPKGKDAPKPKQKEDPGRVRYEPFFKKMYGASAEAVKKNLTTIVWLPKTMNLKLQVTTVNDIHKKMQEISNRLDTMPLLHKYLKNPGGTFMWRKIAGTDRLSMHSFGMTIDVNVEFSDYWRWAIKEEEGDGTRIIEYKNRIPLELVEIFESYGFIWGGKWYHYDTMHFEYRPELLTD
jgi:hypothetical protein